MNGIEHALRDFVALFERLDVPYAVMGGIAVRIYGIPRATYDIDFTLVVSRDRLPEIFASARDMGYSVPEPYEQGWVDRVAGMPVVKVRGNFAERGVDVDLFLAESSFQQELMTRRRRHRLDECDIWFVSPEDLVLLKLIAGRPRDQSDVQDILFVQGQLDESYLRRWADALHVLDRLEKAWGQI